VPVRRRRLRLRRLIVVLVLFVVLWRILSVTPQGNDGAVFAGAPTAAQGGEHSADIPGPDGETVSPTFAFLTTEQGASMRRCVGSVVAASVMSSG